LENNILIISQIFLDVVLLFSVLIIYRRLKRLDPDKIQESYSILEKSKKNIDTIKDTLAILEKNLKEKEKLTKDLQKIIEDIKKQVKPRIQETISIKEEDIKDVVSLSADNFTRGEQDLIESLRKFKD
jgi:uncharacterized membrane protein